MISVFILPVSFFQCSFTFMFVRAEGFACPAKKSEAVATKQSFTCCGTGAEALENTLVMTPAVLRSTIDTPTALAC